MKHGASLPSLVFAAIVAFGAAIAFVLHRLSADIAAITVLGASVAVANAVLWGMHIAGFRNGVAIRISTYPWPLDSIRKATSAIGSISSWIDSFEPMETTKAFHNTIVKNSPGHRCKVAPVRAIGVKYAPCNATVQSASRLRPIRRCAP
jgi:hypothetical protein